jgi:hypothetical protein
LGPEEKRRAPAHMEVASRSRAFDADCGFDRLDRGVNRCAGGVGNGVAIDSPVLFFAGIPGRLCPVAAAGPRFDESFVIGLNVLRPGGAGRKPGTRTSWHRLPSLDDLLLHVLCNVACVGSVGEVHAVRGLRDF